MSRMKRTVLACQMRATIAPGAISKIKAISVPNHRPTRLVWLAG
ncbi:Uncharacterised protein [Mycobacterium tuberculosis]|nr:Uncharacterised protein [Mycobacterium tuberculosis]